MNEDQHAQGGWLKDATAFKEELETCIAGAREELIVGTAYLTRYGTEWLASHIAAPIPVTIVVRWRLEDILSGSSDLESYLIARGCGWEFRTLQNLHAKLWMIDKHELFVGSANATASGLWLANNGNREFGVRVSPLASDIRAVDRLIKDSVLITDELFDRITEVVAIHAGSTHGAPAAWPPEIDRVLAPPEEVSLLWVAECLQSDGKWLLGKAISMRTLALSESCDLSLLGLPADVLASPECHTRLAHGLKRTKIYRWFTDYLASQNGEAYFGALSSSLHDALANDPKPYRQTVKQLLSNLLGWIAVLKIPEVRMDVPQHSQRIKLL